MMIFVISFGAILIGFLLIFLLINKKSFQETPENEFYSEANSPELKMLIAMQGQEFRGLMRRLLSKLGFEIEEMTILDSGGVDFLVFEHHPVKGGRFVIHCISAKENKVIDSTDIINLLDNVKGESALKGILITPHFFTRESLNAAAAAGTQLELINGKRLTKLLKEFGLFELKSGNSGNSSN
ncbi:MAG: hypothetical protein A2042_09370 [Candidatus Schekmanbacteria bacterium GWA2_38_11]|uniref:Restriction endonuclease type IV Mrr domain-containing protein n=1 Tax=Candidatus Schekmanbacteria bacterium GWA2_38_11 TaxID=1817876 RepID=A0A1F7RLZ0_9BACT|nr:MAG: hypothetical protein A2042_09370 [Candidatus Schekmanbacteria bacterium GWA2_38_11]